MNVKPLFIIALIALFPVTAYTSVYKWIDEDGKVHYSQSKPGNNIEVERLRIKGAKPDYATSDAKPEDEMKNKPSDDTKKAEQPVAQPAQEENKLSPKEAKAACQSARTKLAQLQSSGQVRQRDAKGNISYLSDEQKQAEIAKAQKIIKKLCK
ncbi:MAG: DUF4124 domain-containing protein [Gammaproteobacteria bacterium]|nr:DUF4124 domain-containing protein [Gammaproteobacteria bacterium]MDH5734888.1 DUF4124 domain-containing protein [Gammaproteobacteria bacterium]